MAGSTMCTRTTLGPALTSTPRPLRPGSRLRWNTGYGATACTAGCSIAGYLVTPEGHFVGYIGSAIDITIRKEAEHILQQTQEDLEQRVAERTAALHQAMAERQRLEREAQRAEHFAMLGRLAAGVSHEIRNPLGAIFLHFDLLQELLRPPASELPEEIAETLVEIQMNLARLDDLVQDYLSLVRVTQIECTPGDVGAAVQTWARSGRNSPRPVR